MPRPSSIAKSAACSKFLRANPPTGDPHWVTKTGDTMAIARARRDAGMNYWPGFVDALSTLVLGIIFLLTVFVVIQFFLSQEVTGKDTALTRLNAQIAQLSELLALEKTGKLNIEEE